MPEGGLAVELPQFFPKLRAQQPGGDGLEVIHQSGQIKRRMSGKQKVHMISFTATLEQFAPPFLQRIGND
jgi:hypothetical protein